MTNAEYICAANDVIYLLSCTLNAHIPDGRRFEGMNIDHIFRVAKSHSLASMIGFELEKCGIIDSKFSQAKISAIRKTIILDYERAAVLKKLDDAGIWYMPLKGSVIKEIYPEVGMREMADNDILFDASRCEDVRNIMENLGFSTEEFGKSLHDHYYKKPVCNFEMHRILFTDLGDDRFQDYFSQIHTRLLKDKDNQCGYHFSGEDFYIFMIAHEYKDYISSGTGLRSLGDTFIFCKCKEWDLLTKAKILLEPTVVPAEQ